ncbi:MAG: queuosine salvage family protein [Desulfobacteraceae bacterium]|jgi:hypothetical protein
MKVLETARKVADGSAHVRVDIEALERFSRKLLADEVTVPPWEALYHFRGEDEETVAYLLVLDTINFCFWPAPGKAKWKIQYESGWLSGYYALSAALKEALESGIPLTNPEYLVSLSLDQLKDVLGGDGELQLVGPRVENLRELGRVLLEEFEGKAHHLVAGAGRSAVRLARLLAEKLLSFRDVAEYQGHKVYFYKRAQILAADLYGAFDGQGWGRFTDMEELTAFADYKLPQVLRHVGILHYGNDLADKVDRKLYLEAGGPEEVEIRATTIWAVELIRQELTKLGKNLKAFEVDWILWNLGQKEVFKERPYHRTVTIFY